MSSHPRGFFILGAAKCGTTTLHHYLSQHPDLHLSSPKEPFFFEAEYEQGMDYYLDRYFSGWDGKRMIGDARHRNLYLGFVPMRIKKMFPDARLLVVLRNPVDRAYSHWWHWHSRDVDKRLFDEALQDNRERLSSGPLFLTEQESRLYQSTMDFSNGNSPFTSYLDSGHYAEQIQRYIDLFGKERVKVLFLEDLAENPMSVVDSVTDFLEVARLEHLDAEPKNRAMERAGHQVSGFFRKLPGSSRVPAPLRRLVHGLIARRFSGKAPRMAPQIRLELLQHYAPHIHQLEKLTGRNLSHWLSPGDAGAIST